MRAGEPHFMLAHGARRKKRLRGHCAMFPSCPALALSQEYTIDILTLRESSFEETRLTETLETN